MEIWNDVGPQEEKGHVSSVTNAKIQAAQKSQEEVAAKYEKILKDTYAFTDQISELGQRPGEDSHIAIVHIDGNDMARRFHKMTTLEALRNLSKTVQEATENTFKLLLKHIIDRFNDIKDEVHIVKRNGRYILPIRPIILGGDDITFVCDGKLGIYFAKIFMEAFQNQKVSDEEPLSSCAGIAIIKTKYPFSRGYALSEELCSHAKRIRRKNGDDASYLDFHISFGGIFGKLESLRAKYFQVPQGSLMFRPFRVVSEENADGHNLDAFLTCAGKLEATFPRNKRQELQRVVTLSADATHQFVTEARHRGRRLPQIEGGDYTHTLFDKDVTSDEEQHVTPYFDMIELLELYPEFGWKQQGGNTP